MRIKEPKNQNYAAIVVEIKTIIPLEKCDNVQGAIIMGNQVIVSKDVKVGDIGLYFPLECALSKEYLSNNNMYRVHKNKPNLNADTNAKGGYFEESGRVRCASFLGHKSEGLFMPLNSLDFIFSYSNGDLNLNDCFDELNGTPICSKYIVKSNRITSQPKNRNSKFNKKYESKLIENQFRFHQDTSMLYSNLHKIKPNSLISCTYKMHGTSHISSYILCKKKLNWFEKLLIKLGVSIKTKEYDYVYSSRKVIKNNELNPIAQHYYSEDIWGIVHKELEPFLQKGLSIYCEIVGFLPNGGAIQKDYDYGCEPTKHAIYIYRITSTNIDGKVIEFSAKQVQDFCKKNGLNAVPELYYGYAKDFYPYLLTDNNEIWRNDFLLEIKRKYNEKDCYICKNKVPEEGVVVRIEGNDFEAYKAKSERFYARETAQLDKGELNIEDEN